MAVCKLPVMNFKPRDQAASLELGKADSGKWTRFKTFSFADLYADLPPSRSRRALLRRLGHVEKHRLQTRRIVEVRLAGLMASRRLPQLLTHSPYTIRY